MLRNLHVKNLALIHEIDVDFSEGLNILTGETGAGKSIIIGSLMAAIGGKLPRTLLREGEKGALVEALFEVGDPRVISSIQEAGFECEDGLVLISRKFEDGRSICRINGTTAAAASVRECALHLIDIHGQRDYQQLLKTDRQLQLLDEYGSDEIGPAVKKTAEDYRRYTAIQNALKEDSISEEEKNRKLSFLEYEINDIESANLHDQEDDELEASYKKLCNRRKITEAMDKVHEITGYDSAVSAGDLIGRAARELESVASYDQTLKDLYGELSDIDTLLNTFNQDASEYAEHLEDSTDTLEETEERLNTINRLKSKYGSTIPLILQNLADKKKELARLNVLEEERTRLKGEAQKAEKALTESSDELTNLRKKYAKVFETEAADQFKDLNFARSDFVIAFKQKEGFSASGRDIVEFLIATNPGAPPMSLMKIASGGELSRIMLGIRTMFASRDETDTLVFDEIDEGISGRTAQRVAEKLAFVARDHQILCITHLPQIASMADTHYAITKEVTDKEAVTRIDALSEEESVRELARILGGAKITDHTLESAREMKEMCRQYKANEI